MPGAIDAMVSLLFQSQTTSIPRLNDAASSPHFNRPLMGLRILKYLCKDHTNSLKIGETSDLLSMLMMFIEVRGEGEDLVKSQENNNEGHGPALKHHFKMYKKSLQVLLLLAGATNAFGGILPKEHEILHYKARKPTGYP